MAGAASRRTAEFSEPTARMFEINGRTLPQRPHVGPVSMCDGSGGWTFRPSQHWTEEEQLDNWRSIVKEGRGDIGSSPVLLPASLGGSLLQVWLLGSGEELHVRVVVIDDVYNRDMQLPLTGRLKVDIEGRQVEQQFSLHKKDSEITCAKIKTKGFVTEELPKIVLKFTPV